MSKEYELHEGWTDEEWDSQLLRFDESTVFHSRGWAKVVADGFPGCQDQSIWLRPVDGSPEEGLLLPLQRWTRRGVTTLHSTYPFVYGGTVPSHTPDEGPSLARALEKIRLGTSSVQVTGNPFVPEARRGFGETWDLGIGWVQTDDTTHMRSLPATDVDFWENELRSHRRSDVRRLARRGAEVSLGSRADIEAVYRLYEDSFTRWGGRPKFWHPLSYYEAIFDLPATRFTVARFEGKVVGGLFALRWNEKVHSLAFYYDDKARQVRPNVLLHIESIRQAIEDGFSWYDHLPSGGHRRVEEFKEGLGSEKTKLPVWHHTGILHKLITAVRR